MYIVDWGGGGLWPYGRSRKRKCCQFIMPVTGPDPGIHCGGGALTIGQILVPTCTWWALVSTWWTLVRTCLHFQAIFLFVHMYYNGSVVM